MPQLLLTFLPSCFRPPSMQAQLGAGFPAPTAMGRQDSRGQGLGGRATSRQVRGEEGGRQMVMKEKLKGSSFHKYIFFSFSMKKLQLEKCLGGGARLGFLGERTDGSQSWTTALCAFQGGDACPATIYPLLPTVPPAPCWGPGVGYMGSRHRATVARDSPRTTALWPERFGSWPRWLPARLQLGAAAPRHSGLMGLRNESAGPGRGSQTEYLQRGAG